MFHIFRNNHALFHYPKLCGDSVTTESQVRISAMFYC
jgi:hypothetical protein